MPADNPAFPRSKDKTAARWLLKQSRPARGWILLSAGLGVANGLLTIAQAYLIADLVQAAGFLHQPLNELTPFLIMLIFTFGLRALFTWGRENCAFEAGACIRTNIRKRLAKHLFDLGPSTLTRHESGALTAALMEQIEALHPFYGAFLPQLGVAVLVPLAILTAVMPINWAAGLVLLVTAPLIPLFMMLVGMGVESISQRHFEALARMSAYFLDLLKGLATLKLFNRSKVSETGLEEVSEQYRSRTMSVLRVAFLSSAVLEFLSAFAIALLAVYLGMSFLGYVDFGTYGHPLTFREGFFILLLAPDFYLPFRELGTHYHARADAIGAARQVLDILNCPGQMTERPLLSKPREFGNTITIQLSNTRVHYPDRPLPALSSLNMTIGAGEKVALVGSSGAGKTTLINLLLGFVSSQRGHITINGLNLNELNMDDWRRQIAWIDQSPTLFHGTLRENILLGDPQASEADLQWAIEQAGVDQFCRHLPGGTNYAIGERGAGLSQGQIQRIALARAFLKKASLWILDEPTAGLDPQTEARLLEAMYPLTRNGTLILTTHRQPPLKLVDQMVVLHQGRILAKGASQSLLPNNRNLGELMDDLIEEHHES